MRNRHFVLFLAAVVACALAARASAEEFRLLTGVDAGLAPGVTRAVFPSPGPGFPGGFADGDRLAGTADTGAPVVWQGTGSPFFSPNQFGSLSFMYRRGSIPVGGPNRVPLMVIEYLGGPLLDLDGDLGNGSRSLVPVADQSAVAIPGSFSLVDLSFDRTKGSVMLARLDATGTNEGGPDLAPQIGVTVNTLAGTSTGGATGAAINPAVDTRGGSLTRYGGSSGSLASVYRIDGLGFEFWQDSTDPGSSTASTLGTFQFLGALRGWLIERDAGGHFPTLAGEGLGSTLWPLVNTSAVGMTVNTTHPAFPTATITDGVAGDVFSAPNNGGLALSDFAGDLGAYLDAVIVPLVHPLSQSFIYLESVGFGVNNSFDPVFPDSNAYDVVLVAQSAPIPEPASAALLLVGGAAALARRRRG